LGKDARGTAMGMIMLSVSMSRVASNATSLQALDKKQNGNIKYSDDGTNAIEPSSRFFPISKRRHIDFQFYGIYDFFQ
jgi:hypothetical protein